MKTFLVQFADLQVECIVVWTEPTTALNAATQAIDSLGQGDFDKLCLATGGMSVESMLGVGKVSVVYIDCPTVIKRDVE